MKKNSLHKTSQTVMSKTHYGNMAEQKMGKMPQSNIIPYILSSKSEIFGTKKLILSQKLNKFLNLHSDELSRNYHIK
jgi:hypothetical protein